MPKFVIKYFEHGQGWISCSEPLSESDAKIELEYISGLNWFCGIPLRIEQE